MVVNIADVTSLYQKTGGIIDDAGAGASPTAGGQTFGDMVKNFVGDTVSSLHDGEKAAIGSVSGKADLASIATAIDNAEVLLTEITTIRDKAITAYQSITSSAI